MIDLKVDGKPVSVYRDGQISIERTSPVLNDDAGSFSYSFAVPTPANQVALGYPGWLQRSGKLDGQQFVLKDGGITVARGEVGYNTITRKDTELYLKSGNSEFFGKMKDKDLSDLDYGGEDFPTALKEISGVANYNSYDAELKTLMERWTDCNAVNNGKYRCFPFAANDSKGYEVVVNKPGADSLLHYETDWGFNYFCLQFDIGFILEKIFENADYEIVENEFRESSFYNVVIFGKIMTLKTSWKSVPGDNNDLYVLLSPAMGGRLDYATLMPDFDVGDFVQAMEELFCMTCHFDDVKRSVSIRFNKTIFQRPEKKTLNGSTVDWEHGELEDYSGLKLGYDGQDDDGATDCDYEIFDRVATYDDLPAVDSENKDLVWTILDTDRDYILSENEDGDLEYKRIGRLKPYVEGKGENGFSIPVKIPYQTMKLVTFIAVGDSGSNVDKTIELPFLSVTISWEDSFTDVALYVSMYRYRKNITAEGTLITIPYATFDRFNYDGTQDLYTSLLPAYLYEQLHSEFVKWQTYRMREVTKYIELSLLQVVALQWDVQYIVEGVPILLNKINFDLPYKGLVELGGYTI